MSSTAAMARPVAAPPTTSSGLCEPRNTRASPLQAASTNATTPQRRGHTRTLAPPDPATGRAHHTYTEHPHAARQPEHGPLHAPHRTRPARRPQAPPPQAPTAPGHPAKPAPAPIEAGYPTNKRPIHGHW